ncbi:uncharacterized protein VP01_8650g1 [Puccinia sorghi]|uniref:Retrotransposon gag domain-containing protein n=1 Tax=Puccinia sorghi TaxID=27349 RepID=A0A0L6U9I9_9BASI|nr:uncharacterized protein VP01_8650g1 [Puccinia sorghi]
MDRGTAAKAFVGHIGLHDITYPQRFPTDSIKVAFAVLFMKDYAANWSQPYLDKVFNGELVVFNDFLNDFKSSFFDHNHRHRAEVALQNLCQTVTVLAYMQDFNQHTRIFGWANTPLMSLYQHGLKEKIQLAVVMSNLEFDSMQVMALKAGPTLSLTQFK